MTTLVSIGCDRRPGRGAVERRCVGQARERRGVREAKGPAAVVARVALLGCALVVGAADGKKKGKGGNAVSVLKLTAAGDPQLRRDFRARQRRQGQARRRGRRPVLGNVPLTDPKKAKPGKTMQPPPLGRRQERDGQLLDQWAPGPARQGQEEEEEEERQEERRISGHRTGQGPRRLLPTEGTEVRPPRPDRLPAALAERLLHQGGLDHGDRAAARSAGRRDARQPPAASTSIRPTSTAPTASARATRSSSRSRRSPRSRRSTTAGWSRSPILASTRTRTRLPL